MLALHHRSLAGFTLAVLPLAGTALAQQPSTTAAWQRFQTTAGGQWVAQWNEATGTPRAIYGDGIALPGWNENSLDAARHHALAALQQWPDLLGLGSSEFRESIGARMGRQWSFTFTQHFAGLPVLDGRVDVRIHMRGKLSFLGSDAVPIAADFATTPKVAEATAVAAAWQHLGLVPNDVPQPGADRPNRLVVWTDSAANAPAEPVLAWEVPIRAIDRQGDGPLGRAYIDAQTGAWLQFRTDKHACGRPDCTPRHSAPVPAVYTVMAWTHTGLSPVSVPTNVPLAGVEVQVPGLGTLVTDQNGQFTADLAVPTTVNVVLNGIHSRVVLGPNALSQQLVLQPGVPATFQLGAANAGEQPLAHSTCYQWTWRVAEWARSILGPSAQLAIADQVLPTVNIGSSCNAFYSGNSINFYASGGGCNNTAAASVVAHEWGHGLDDQYGGISQVNGLSEGWGDICSMYLLDDPQIGHDFFSGGGGIRNGNNGRQYPQGGGVHDMGESWMGFAWLFRQNLRTTLGTPQALAISNDVVLGSIVANAQDQQAAVLQAFLADDDDGLLLNGTPHYNELVAACQAHSLPFPARQAGYLLHTALPTTTAQLQPRRVDVQAIPVTGSFAQVRLHWNDGQPRQRDLIQNGAPNGWYGLLPGQLAPQAVAYHFEAVHSNSTTFRLPASGEFQYGTLAERSIFREDFETGGPGWTHGANTGSDDWQIGVPAGRSGSGWSDPAAAASGQRCAGTDLGGTGDGAYAPSSEMWLRSPAIDCTGITNVRLRCRIWLSCEGPGDQLEIRVGNLPIWLSPQQPLQASGWTSLDLAMPGATNNPTTVFEFRLRSNSLFEYGGWNLDDVELYTTSQTVALPASLTLLPEQASAGTPVTIRLQTQGSQPFLLAIGDAPGPTLIPGVPPLLAGGALLTVFQFTDAAGLYTSGFPAPAAVPLQGVLWYSHALTLGSNGAILGSNGCVNLFTL